MNIILIGHRSSGKTSVGKRLAERLSCPFYDTDRLIEQETSLTVGRLVSEGGWPLFRQKEKEIVGKLDLLKNCVIATGGGMVMDLRNASKLKGLGIVAWLVADAETIRKRMLSDPATVNGRPSLSGADFLKETELLLAQRNPVYRNLADYAVDTSKKGIDQVAEDIYRFIRAGKDTPRQDVSYGW